MVPCDFSCDSVTWKNDSFMEVCTSLLRWQGEKVGDSLMIRSTFTQLESPASNNKRKHRGFKLL